MSESWDITFGHIDGRKSWETRSYSVPDEDLREVQEELAEAFPQGYEVVECEEWEGIDFKTRRFSAEEIWKIAEIANAQESPAAFLGWVGETNAVSLGIPEDLEQRFQTAYWGEFKDRADFAKEFATSQGLPDWVWTFVDWDGLGRGLAVDYTIAELSSGMVAVFRQS